jgi:hypothetical protein
VLIDTDSLWDAVASLATPFEMAVEALAYILIEVPVGHLRIAK